MNSSTEIPVGLILFAVIGTILLYRWFKSPHSATKKAWDTVRAIGGVAVSIVICIILVVVCVKLGPYVIVWLGF